jgi:Ca2+/Na+ antiporter
VTARRAATIAAAVGATMIGVGALLFIPLSIAVGKPLNALIETAILVVCVWFVARVMRADRRARLAREATLPPERRPQRRQPRRPITFDLKETLVTFAVWFALIFGFNALVLAMDAFVNGGVSVASMKPAKTLTVTGRHMMFRLTAEEDD